MWDMTEPMVGGMLFVLCLQWVKRHVTEAKLSAGGAFKGALQHHPFPYGKHGRLPCRVVTVLLLLK